MPRLIKLTPSTSAALTERSEVSPFWYSKKHRTRWMFTSCKTRKSIDRASVSHANANIRVWTLIAKLTDPRSGRRRRHRGDDDGGTRDARRRRLIVRLTLSSLSEQHEYLSGTTGDTRANESARASRSRISSKGVHWRVTRSQSASAFLSHATDRRWHSNYERSVDTRLSWQKVRIGELQ